ncbi:MAG: trypsin-like peptidase domain-containing protein [Planctomycetota bacterium]|nr:trypsin-like peptidase domain-containing protein [Planctomycetota bacterium]
MAESAFSKAFLVLVGAALLPIAAALGGEPEGIKTLDFREVIKSAKDKVFPAVVFVKCLRESHEEGKKVTREISGSGVIISPDGELLTNWHVIDKAVEVRCLLYDGRAYNAKVVGSDKDTDLALVKLTEPAQPKDKVEGEFPHAVIGDSTKLKEGDFVMAMGAPWGLSRSVSMGIISCTRRYLPENSEYSLWLQSDASISPGNSGGPLVNTNGEVIGINSRSVIFGGDMGFAVPSETINFVVAQLREHGKMNWSWSGLQLQPLRDFNKNMYFDEPEGVIVADTDPESPARRAGIQPLDRIIKINGQPVTAVTEEDLPAVRRLIGGLAMHQPVAFEIVREGKTITVEISPREKGKVEGEELDCPRWDFTVKVINQFDNPDLYFHRKEGVFVFGVKYPGNAQSAGLQQQDIIIAIDGKEVKTLEDIKKIHAELTADIAAKHRAVFTILRNGLRRQIVLDYERDYEKE